jgi:tetratricopeptide (TPR) repeat protein
VRARIREASDAVRREPRSGEAWGRLGAVHEIHGFYAEAITCYARASELDPSDGRWPYFAGLCLRRSDQEKAALSFLRAARLRPDHVPVLVTLAEALLKLERLDEAETHFIRASELNAGCAPAWAGLGAIALRRRNPDQAVEHLKRAVSLAPRYKNPHELLVQAHRLRGEVPAAEENARIAATCGPEVPLPEPERDVLWWKDGMSFEWRSRRAAQYRKVGRPLDALQEWEEIAADQPDSPLAHEELAALNLLLGRADAAGRHRLRAQELDPTSATLPFKLGVALSELRRDAEAIAAFEEALRLNPGFLEARVNLGSVFLRSGRREEGTRQLRAALKAAPDDATALFNLGIALVQDGNYSEAAGLFERLSRIEPQHVQVFDQWAITLTRLRRPADAIAVCRSGLKLNPGNATTANRLAWLLAAGPEAALRDGAEALAIARGLCEASGYQNPVVLDTLAVALAETGDFKAAIEIAERALRLVRDGSSQGTTFDPGLAGRMQGRLDQFFRRGLPYHGPQ